MNVFRLFGVRSLTELGPLKSCSSVFNIKKQIWVSLVFVAFFYV